MRTANDDGAAHPKHRTNIDIGSMPYSCVMTHPMYPAGTNIIPSRHSNIPVKSVPLGLGRLPLKV